MSSCQVPRASRTGSLEIAKRHSRTLALPGVLIFFGSPAAGTSDPNLQFIVLLFPTRDTLVLILNTADVAEGVAQDSGHWPAAVMAWAPAWISMVR